MTQTAIDAIKAAKNRKSWGLFGARRYCEKRGVPLGLYRLACQLEAAQKAGV
jgi:hypothetical protein